MNFIKMRLSMEEILTERNLGLILLLFFGICVRHLIKTAKKNETINRDDNKK